MPHLSNRRVAVLQKKIKAFLTDTCTIRGLAGNPRTLQTIASNVPCRVKDDSEAGDPRMAELNQNEPTKIIEVGFDTTLKVGYFVDHGGHSYEIFAMMQDQTPNIDNKAKMRAVTP